MAKRSLQLEIPRVSLFFSIVRHGQCPLIVVSCLSPALQNTVMATGIKYLFLGRELGGRPQDLEFYDNQGFVLYSRIAESPLFLEGIERLITGIKTYRVALMCGEENPVNCHRRLLVGPVLAERGVSVRHIREKGEKGTFFNNLIDVAPG